MTRFSEDIPTTKTSDEVDRALTTYLTREGFARVQYGQEEVWKKGMGLTLGPQFVKATAGEGKVHLEAWTKFAIVPGVYLGEVGTTGFVGAIPKRKLRERVAQIEALVR